MNDLLDEILRLFSILWNCHRSFKNCLDVFTWQLIVLSFVFAGQSNQFIKLLRHASGLNLIAFLILNVDPCFVSNNLHQFDFFHVATDLRPSLFRVQMRDFVQNDIITVYCSFEKFTFFAGEIFDGSVIGNKRASD